MADYFVLSTASSDRQARAIADAIAEKLGPANSVEGMASAHWILLDYGDVVFHVFQEEARKFYALERLWGDAANETGLLQRRLDAAAREQAAALAASHGGQDVAVPPVALPDAQSRARARDRGDRAGRGSSVHDPDPRRERHREGPPRPRHPRRLVPRREPVRPRRRREPLRRALRERALRPRARRLHRAPSPPRRACSRSPRTATVYLDEVSSLSPAAQAKFLRVLQEKNFRRLAGVTTHPFRARLIVSSRRDLASLVEQGAFRDDFFYRIDVVSVRLPRLAERREDMLPLAREFAARAARAYERPARDVHEGGRADPPAPPLAGQRSRAAARRREGGSHGRVAGDRARGSSGRSARGARIAPRRRPSRAAGPCGSSTDAYIDETVRRAGGNRSLAAKRLGVSRKFLWEREKK